MAQKQELLTQAVSATGEKLEILKSAAEQAQTQLEKGTISQGQFNALQQEITATVQSLTNYQGQLGQTSSESSKLQSELQTQENALSENATETQNLANQVSSLSSEYSTNQQKTQQSANATEELANSNETLSGSTEESKTSSEKLISTLVSQKTKLDELKKQYMDAVLQYGKNSTEAQNLAGEIKTLSSEYGENKKKMGDAINAAEELTNENDDLSNSTEDVADNENELSKENADLSNSMGKVEKSTGQAETGANNFGNSIEKTKNKVSAATIAMGNVLADLGKKAISSLWDVAKSSVETGKAFEKSMSNVTALQQAAGASAEDIASLKKVAEDYGASTQFTMAECADALGYMALAGWDAEQSASALPGVLSLSAASGMDLASASDMVTDYMSAFSKSVSDYTGEALTAAEFSDKLAYAQANSNTNVQQLGEAYKNCAANMNAAGQQMDTVTAILGTLANQGLKGSESGTALSAVMRDINNSMENGAISIAGTTVAIADANGNYRDLIDIMADVEAITGNMSETERSAALSSVFTADSIKGMNLVLNSGVDSVRKLEAGLSDCAGAADEAAATLNDNLDGDLKYMDSAFDAVKNSIYEGICPALRTLVQSVTSDVAPQLQELVTGLLGVVNGVDGAGEQMQNAISALAEWAINLVSEYLPKILTALTEVLGQLVVAIVNNAPALFNALLDSLFGMADALTVIAPQLLTALAELLQQVLSKLFASIPKMVQTATEFFGGILDALLSLDLTSAFTELLDLLVRRLIYAVPKLTEAAEKFFNQIIDELPNFIDGAEQITDSILDALETIIPELLPLAKSLLNTLVNGLKTALPKLSDFAKEFLQKISNFIQENLPDLIETALQIITTLCEFLLSGENIQMLLTIAIQILSAITTALIDNLPLLISSAVQLISFLCENLLTEENIGILIDTAIQIVKALCENLLTGENLELLLQAALDLVNALVNAIVDNLDDLLLAAEEIIRKLCDELKNPEKIKEIVALGTEILAKLIVGICEIGGQLAGFALSLNEEIRSACEDIDWAELGTQILEGILSGLLGVDFDLGSFFGEFGDNFVTGIKDIFGIHSPSKVMRDEIGKFLLPGIAVGMEDSTDDTTNAINHALDDMLNSVDMDALQMQLNSAVQMQGYNSIMPSVLAKNSYSYENEASESNENANLESPKNTQMNPKFSIYIGDTEIKDFVIKAIDEANIVSGGVSV